jgi:hypothetical protein
VVSQADILPGLVVVGFHDAEDAFVGVGSSSSSRRVR